MATKMGSKRTKPKKGLTKNPIKKVVKKKGRRVIIRRLDAIFSKYIRDKAENKCEFCGKSGVRVECHHAVVKRRYMNTRFEEDNAVCVCGGCHRFLDSFPAIATDFLKKKVGTARVEQLGILARSGVKIDLDKVESELKGKVKATI